MVAKMNLTEKEVHEHYGLPLRFLRSLRMRGGGPRWIKIAGRIGERGGRVLYPKQGVEDWLASRPGGGGVA
jgi:hypothetical protein